MGSTPTIPEKAGCGAFTTFPEQAAHNFYLNGRGFQEGNAEKTSGGRRGRFLLLHTFVAMLRFADFSKRADQLLERDLNSSNGGGSRPAQGFGWLLNGYVESLMPIQWLCLLPWLFPFHAPRISNIPLRCATHIGHPL